MISGEEYFGPAVEPQDTIFLNAGADNIAVDVVGKECNRALIEDALKLEGIME